MTAIGFSAKDSLSATTASRLSVEGQATMSAMTVDQADTILRVFSDPHKIEKLVCDINSPYLADARASLRRSIEAMESQVEHLRRIAEREGITETTREDYDEQFEGHRR
jgi:hypothetical protein